MKLVDVWIEGTSSLLQHRFSEQAETDVRSSTRRVHIGEATPRTLAERVAYRDADGCLFLPGSAIARLLRESGANHKQRGSRRSIKFLVPGAILVLEDGIPLYGKDRSARLADFEVDARPVTIPSTKGRIMRFRPRLDTWTANFHLRINDDLLTPATVRQLLVEGGQQLGVGDFRPERGGPFGTFAVASWSEASEDTREVTA